MLIIDAIARTPFNLGEREKFSLKDAFEKSTHAILSKVFLRALFPWAMVHTFILLCLNQITHENYLALESVIFLLLELFIMSGMSVTLYRLLAFQNTSVFLALNEDVLRFLGAYFGLGGLLIAGVFSISSFIIFLSKIITFQQPFFVILMVVILLGMCISPFVYVYLGVIGLGGSVKQGLQVMIPIVRPIYASLFVGYLCLSLFIACFSVGLFSMIHFFLPSSGMMFKLLFHVWSGVFSVACMTTFTSYILHQRCVYRRV